MDIRMPAAVLVLLAGALVFSACQSDTPPVDEPDVVVDISGSPVLRQVEPGLVLGANFGAWVSHTKLGTATRDLVKSLRPSVGRFPGGNLANNYCWKAQKVSDNDHLVWNDWSWGTDVDQFIAFMGSIGCVPMFSLNPFDHTIDGEPHSAAFEAADLAALFVAGGFAGAYFEVGNENDGSWNPMLSIAEYADRFALLMRAVRAIDPAAQGMGPVGSGEDMTWINGFLDRLTLLGATDLLDWISFHRYGGWISNGNQNGIDLDDPQEYGGNLETIRAALDSRGLTRVKIAVTELNAAIWDVGCTRDQFTIKQGLWLADALGVSLMKADAANVWIHLHPGADPHSLIDDGTDPPRPTRNYWPVALAAQTLAGTDPAVPVDVLRVELDAGPSVMTGYAVGKAGAGLGVLLINKSGAALDVAVDLPGLPASVSGRRIGAAEYDASSGPAAIPVSIESGRARLSVPATAMVGLEIR